MNRYCVLTTLVTMLASAGVAHAQAPAVPPMPIYGLPYDLVDLQTPPLQESGLAWHVRAWNETASAWMRIRALCGTTQKDSTCCKDASAKAARNALGLAGIVMSGEALQPKACACAKACACCEACKASKEKKPQVQTPLTPEMLRRLAGLHGVAQPQPMTLMMPNPFSPGCLPPNNGSGIVQIMPVPQIHVMQVVQVAHQAKPVQLITPDLEAHCERMHHRGDVVVLEGNVLLLCKKHAQPIRVQAHRVTVNMRDGSFTVESEMRTVPVTTFGVQRTSVLTPAAHNDLGCTTVTLPAAALRPTPTPPTTERPTPAATPQTPATTERHPLFQYWKFR